MSNLADVGIVCALGAGKEAVLQACLNGDQSGMQFDEQLHFEKPCRVGKVSMALPSLEHFEQPFQNRTNQLVLLAYQQIEKTLKGLDIAPSRLGVVMGTSTSGIATGELAIEELLRQGDFPDGFDYKTQEMYGTAEFVALLSGAKGPTYSISTACSSSAKSLISAYNLIHSGVIDAAIVGGADSLCQLTVNGFSALESISQDFTTPFSQGRDGINIGEGAALFVMTKQPQGIGLLGFAESADAHHISAPDPTGLGAIKVMSEAMMMAGKVSNDIDYLNLHGTGTVQNDLMESQAVNQLLENTPCSSTKSLTGHTLGAAGAIEAAVCWLLLSEYNTQNGLPGNVTNREKDPSLAAINLLQKTQYNNHAIECCLSNSFAFGGSNAALLLGKTHNV